ncbi:MobA/MobL family protein, partial [Azohydromonas caseinilytica]
MPSACHVRQGFHPCTPGSVSARRQAVAIFHASTKSISRSAGRSAVAAIAYRTACRLVDERTGQVHDYTRKG